MQFNSNEYQKSTAGLIILIILAVLIYLLAIKEPQSTPVLNFSTGLFLAVTGLLAGWVGALIGIGGGVILLPVLHFALAYPAPISVGTSLLIVMFASASGGYGHLIRKNVSFEAVRWLAPTAVAGVLLGSWLFTILAQNTSVLGLILGIAFIIPSFLMIWESIFSTKAKTSNKTALTVRPFYMSLLGFIAGTLSGLLGLGGGYLLVPGLLYIFNMPVFLTVGTSLAVIFPVSFIGSIFKLAGGYIDIYAALIVSAGTIVGAQIGAGTIKYYKPQTLKLIFSFYFLYISIKFIISFFS